MQAMKRKMTKKDRDRINRRFARRQQRRKHKRVSRNHKARAVLQNDCFVFLLQNDNGIQCDTWSRDHWSGSPCRERTKVYHTHKMRADGKRAWQGGRDLPLSAAFTWPFCRKLLECWENRGSAELNPDPVARWLVHLSGWTVPWLDRAVCHCTVE